MVHLVDDLLDVARISTGKVELRRQRTDLKEIVATAVETSASLIDAGGHKLSVEVPSEPLPMDADPTRIAQVVSNLLNNAAKYTPPGGRIALKVRVEGQEAVLGVTDTGVGIAADAIDKVFEMFAQVPGRQAAGRPGHRPVAAVQSLVSLHGGSVSATSPGWAGQHLPPVRLPLLAAASDAASAPSTSNEPARPGQLQVLVVDDNTDAAESLGVLLDIEGHAAHIAHTGAEALQVAQTRPLDVVFLDIGLPDMTGYDVAKRMRMLGMQKTLLVALTGWGTQDDRQRTRDAGFDRHLASRRSCRPWRNCCAPPGRPSAPPPGPAGGRTAARDPSSSRPSGATVPASSGWCAPAATARRVPRCALPPPPPPRCARRPAPSRRRPLAGGARTAR